jgi:Coenzyme PQQ synthesis protein D (PqqD)
MPHRKRSAQGLLSPTPVKQDARASGVDEVQPAEHRWQRDERTLARSAPGLVVLLGEAGGDPIVLRGTGVAVWEALDRPQGTDELARLAAKFNGDLGAVRSDIEPVIARLGAAGVLRATS